MPAQPRGQPVVVAFVSERTLPPQYLDALRQGMSARGWVEGRSFRIEPRSADGDLERLPGIVAELIGLDVGLIVTGLGSPVALAAKRATAKIPIVFVTGGDPVEFGIVASAERPGGNVTGYGGGIAIIEQRVAALRDVVPHATRFAVLANLTNPIHARIVSATSRTAHQFGILLREVGVFEASELDDAFTRMRDQRLQALIVPGDAMFSHHRERIVRLAAAARLPAMYGDRVFPEQGGLMSLSVDLVELCRRAAGHVDRILRGASPGSLRVGEATRFELVVNARAAQAVGLTLPGAVLQRAEVLR